MVAEAPVEEIDPVEAAFAAADAEPEVLDLKPDQIAARPVRSPRPRPRIRPAAPDPFAGHRFSRKPSRTGAETGRRRAVRAHRGRRCAAEPGSPRPAATFHVRRERRRAPRHATQHAVANAFGTLETAVFGSSGRTVEDLTKELLRPMLKVWLDDNLPTLVERWVREEIERVARGRR